MSGDEKEVNKQRLYVGNVPFTSTVEGIEELFAGVGGVKSAEIVQNRNGRSRGFAIVEMESEEKAVEAISAFNEYEFEGRTIFVRVDEQPEPRAERTVTPTRKLFIGNLPFSVTSEQLTDIFGESNDVVKAEVMVDRRTNLSRGYGIVEFKTVAEATAAIEEFDNHEIDGRNIRVRFDRVRNKSRPRRRVPIEAS